LRAPRALLSPSFRGSYSPLLPVSTSYQHHDPSLESQWRAIILFGKNSATYKFAFAQALLELVEAGTTTITLPDLAEPFSRHLVRHLQQHDKQGNASSSKFLTTCRRFLAQELSQAGLLAQTEKLGFVNVVDAFQVVNSGVNSPPHHYISRRSTRTTADGPKSNFLLPRPLIGRGFLYN
jgi:hypothetical protein